MDRCEPPEYLRGRDGYHWVHSQIGRAFVVMWRASSGGRWCWGVTGYPDQVYESGVRYVAPVMDWHEVDDMRAEIGRLKGIIRVNALRAGLTHDDVDAVIGGTI